LVSPNKKEEEKAAYENTDPIPLDGFLVGCKHREASFLISACWGQQNPKDLKDHHQPCHYHAHINRGAVRVPAWIVYIIHKSQGTPENCNAVLKHSTAGRHIALASLLREARSAQGSLFPRCALPCTSVKETNLRPGTSLVKRLNYRMQQEKGKNEIPCLQDAHI